MDKIAGMQILGRRRKEPGEFSELSCKYGCLFLQKRSIVDFLLDNMDLKVK